MLQAPTDNNNNNNKNSDTVKLRKKKETNISNKRPLPGRPVQMNQQARLGCEGTPPNGTATSPPLVESMVQAARAETTQATTGASRPLQITTSVNATI